MTPIESKPSPLTLKVAFLDVGQGDTIVISCSETHEAFVVDCIDANAVLEYLEQEQIQFLRSIVITHLHSDHYSGVVDLLENYTHVPGLQNCAILAINDFLNRREWDQLLLDKDGDMHSTESEITLSRKTHLENLRRWTANHKEKCAPLHVSANPLCFSGQMENNTKTLHPYYVDYNQLTAMGLNNTSVVIRVNGPGASALLTGDLEPTGWRFLMKNRPDDLRSDVLKFPHHGGAWSTSDTESLLNAVQPSVVVLSVGTSGGEKYKHPNEEVFKVLASPLYSHIHVLCTQATHQCCASVNNQRKDIIQRLERDAESRGQERIGSKRGCPCAGTVIVELGEKASVVQPSQIFHQNSIIHPHFSPTHKCII